MKIAQRAGWICLAACLSGFTASAQPQPQTAEQQRKAQSAELKQERKDQKTQAKADKAQAKADKEERKALNTKQAKKAAKAQDAVPATATTPR